MAKKFKGHITISRVTSGKNPEGYISIEIEDNLSGIHFIRTKISLKDFALALTGLGCIDCDLELRGLDTIGKKREHKEEIIDFDKMTYSYNQDDDYIRKTIATYEIDGWMGKDEDANNHHRWVKGGINRRRIRFVRYVNVEQVEENNENSAG